MNSNQEKDPYINAWNPHLALTGEVKNMIAVNKSYRIPNKGNAKPSKSGSRDGTREEDLNPFLDLPHIHVAHV